MIYQPYPIQLEAIEHLKHALKQDKRVIFCAPTGAGKTVMSSHMLDSSLKKGKRVIILCHRIEILEQFYVILNELGIEPFLVTKGNALEFGHQIYLGMMETWYRRSKGNDVIKKLGCDLLFCDEIHWAGYKKVVDPMSCYVVGLTATPKSSGPIPLNRYFDSIVAPMTVGELLELGYLVPGKTYGVSHDFSHIGMKKGDFDIKALYREFKKPILFKGALENYERYARNEKAICYNVNVEHSIEMQQQFLDAGYHAYHVDGTTPDHIRRQIFSAFASRKDGILCNVGVATTGYDEPTVTTIILNRATVQLTLKVQMDGRGARQCKEIGKDHFKIIDMGRNYLRHGLFGEFIDWVSIFNDPREDKEKTEHKAALKECKECGAIIKSQLKCCPYCNVSYTQVEIDEFIENNATLEEIKTYRFQTLPPHLRGIKVGKMNYTQLCQYAHHMGYKDSWVGVQLAIQKKFRAKKS